MKVFFAIALALLTVLFVVGGGFYWFSLSSWPVHEGSIVMPGLQERVVVTRDKWGVPHIEAQNEPDLYRALGFTMAGDRLFQMDLLRRIANGQISEIFGQKALPSDILLRHLRLRKHADELWRLRRHKMDSHMIRLCEAFLEGVHHYVQTNALPVEFKILGYRPGLLVSRR